MTLNSYSNYLCNNILFQGFNKILKLINNNPEIKFDESTYKFIDGIYCYGNFMGLMYSCGEYV